MHVTAAERQVRRLRPQRMNAKWWRRRESNAAIPLGSMPEGARSHGVTAPLANARGPSRPTTVPYRSTVADADLSGLVVLLARAIEATAENAPWIDSVQLAPGFAEEAARLAVGQITRASPADQGGSEHGGEGGTGRGRRRAISR